MEEVADTLWLCYARQLNHYASCLFKTLDVRLSYAETVDTCAEYGESVGNGGVGLFTKHGYNLAIRHATVDAVFHIYRREYSSKLAVWA